MRMQLNSLWIFTLWNYPSQKTILIASEDSYNDLTASKDQTNIIINIWFPKEVQGIEFIAMN